MLSLSSTICTCINSAKWSRWKLWQFSKSSQSMYVRTCAHLCMTSDNYRCNPISQYILCYYLVNVLQLKNATDAFIRHNIIHHDIDQSITWPEMCTVASSMFQSVERQCSSEVVNVAWSVDLLTSWGMDIFDMYVAVFSVYCNLVNVGILMRWFWNSKM